MVNWLDWQDSFVFRYLTKRSHKKRFVSHTCLKSTRKQGSKVLNNGRELTRHESIHFSHMHHLDVLNHVQRETHPKFAHFFFQTLKTKGLVMHSSASCKSLHAFRLKAERHSPCINWNFGRNHGSDHLSG